MNNKSVFNIADAPPMRFIVYLSGKPTHVYVHIAIGYIIYLLYLEYKLELLKDKF